ncbi:hypothetical protein SAMN05660209_03797 [Geodermatophilus africanus]|uniref:Uncharacterized protein n=1 Tax=Geodermatophilus africanus TaxID=1137993 RepID=A0A1H3N150_9ACTN|nr:hypothetical protein SAMN05660209_03797 [Geodermatophilus africanus]
MGSPGAVPDTGARPGLVRGIRPHAHFEWSEGNPLGHLFRYLLLGRGDTPPVVREIIREAEPDPARRSGIHVGG